MTTGVSYKAKWLAAYEAERDYYAEEPRPFEKWDRDSKPEWTAEWELRNALRVLYATAERAIADKFLSAALEVVARAFAEDKFHSKYAEMAFPENRGSALRARAYACAIKTGTFDASDLVNSGRDIEAYWSKFGPEDWDSQTQAYFLDVVRMALIAGDLVGARNVLQTKRSFKWHAEEHRLLKNLIEEALYGTPIRNEQLLSHITEFFDEIRDPDFKPNSYMELEIVRLEWGAIINKYFETGASIDWNRVIELVSQ